VINFRAFLTYADPEGMTHLSAFAHAYRFPNAQQYIPIWHKHSSGTRSTLRQSQVDAVIKTEVDEEKVEQLTQPNG